jgi:diaminopimelate decarboxylase
MLYGTRFAPAVLDSERPLETCDLVGQHCESGDVLARHIELAAARPGDRVVVPATGAYTYSLQNNYNGARRPPVVFVRGGHARLVVRRERISDLLARDVPASVVAGPWRRSAQVPAPAVAGEGRG